MSSLALRPIVVSRAEKYKRAALAEKQAGNLELAKKYAINYKLCQRSLELIDQGQPVDLSSVPADLDLPSASASSATPPPPLEAPRQAAVPAPVTPAVDDYVAILSVRVEKYKRAALSAKHEGDLPRAKQLAVDWKRCQKLLERLHNGEPVEAAWIPADIEVDLTPPPEEPRLHMETQGSGRVVRPFPPEVKQVQSDVMQEPDTQRIISEEQRQLEEQRKWQQQQWLAQQEQGRRTEYQRVHELAKPAWDPEARRAQAELKRQEEAKRKAEQEWREQLAAEDRRRLESQRLKVQEHIREDELYRQELAAKQRVEEQALAERVKAEQQAAQEKRKQREGAVKSQASIQDLLDERKRSEERRKQAQLEEEREEQQRAEELKRKAEDHAKLVEILKQEQIRKLEEETRQLEEQFEAEFLAKLRTTSTAEDEENEDWLASEAWTELPEITATSGWQFWESFFTLVFDTRTSRGYADLFVENHLAESDLPTLTDELLGGMGFSNERSRHKVLQLRDKWVDLRRAEQQPTTAE